MPGTRGKNTMAEALQSILPEISYMKTLPDADLPFLLDLETLLLKKLRAPVEEMVGQMDGQLPPSGLMTGAGSAPGMSEAPMPGAIPGAPTPPPGVPGIRQGVGMPNPDELRRMISTR